MVAFENLTPAGWFYIIIGVVGSVFFIGFFGVLVRNYFKKRTVGTGLLLLFFGTFILADILTNLGTWTNATMIFGDNSVLVHGYMQIFSLILNLTSFIFFYYFANRHILRDSDITKSFTSIILTLLLGVLGGMMVSELIAEYIPDALAGTYGWGLDQEGFTQYIAYGGTGTYQFIPHLIAALVIFIPIILIIFVRIIYRLIVIRRNLKEKVARTGVTLILLSVIFIFLERAVAVLFTQEAITNNGALVVTINIIRVLCNISIVVFAYLGWILPDWLKKAIRGKAWIVKSLDKKKVKTQKYSFISSETATTEIQTVVEVADP
ncbi:MAG: hypothetical protein ACTSQ0_03890 [Candidatus Heimdallarchaeota archaeon]